MESLGGLSGHCKVRVRMPRLVSGLVAGVLDIVTSVPGGEVIEWSLNNVQLTNSHTAILGANIESKAGI